MTLFDAVIREAGTAAEKGLGAGNDERGFSLHLAGHAVMEEVLTGRCTKALDVMAPCPYCGKLPPGMVFPRTSELAS